MFFSKKYQLDNILNLIIKLSVKFEDQYTFCIMYIKCFKTPKEEKKHQCICYYQKIGCSS